MQKAKQACFYCLHKLWLALAICLVVLATVVSVLRLALPYADSYKHYIEQMLTQQLGTPVAIENISAAWHKNGPALILQHVRVAADAQLQLEIAQTAVQINFWQSMLARQITAEHFELDGLRYWLHLDTLLADEPVNADDAVAKLQGLEQLFFRRLKAFSVKNSQFILVSKSQPELVLNISRLNWRNAGLQHQGHGELSIADVTANNLSFILDLHGSTLSDASGQLYLQSAELDVIPLFRQWLPQASRLQKASINFRAWGAIEQGQLQQVQLELAENSLHWLRAGEQHSIQLGAGQLQWQPSANGWQLQTGELSLASQTEQWSGLQLQLSQTDQQLHAKVQHFQLDALAPLLQLFAEDSKWLEGILAHQPSGYLEQLHLSLQPQFRLYGQFRDFSSKPVKDIPGVQQVSGQFWAANDFAWLLLTGEQQHLSWDGLFTDNWYYQHLYADIRLLQRHGLWQLQLPQVELQAEDFHLAAQASLDFSPQPALSLLAQLTALDAAKASQYYPQRYMPITTREYLTGAIEGGKLQQATVIWHGAFADYPFHAGEGHFQVRADLADGILAFAPDWPALTDLNAVLWFENASMLIEANQGYLGLLPLTDPVTASIPDLFNATQLAVRVNTEIESTRLTELMLQSSLRDTLGKTLTHLGLAGPVQGDLLLEIGLTEASVIASGTAELLQIQADIQAPQLSLQQLTGKVHFRNEQLKGEQLNFIWQGLPVSGHFIGEQQATAYQVNMQLAGQARATELHSALALENNELLAGSLDWQLQLGLSLPEKGFSYQAEWSAELEPLALNLPAPYQKNIGDAAALQLVAHGNAEQSYITADYQQLLHFQAELPHNSGRINRAQLTLGPEDPGLSGKGFNIDVNLAEIELLPWLDFLQPILSKSAAEEAVLPPLNRVRGRVARVQLPAALSVNNTVFELSANEHAWQLHLHGTELASHWQFFHDWQNKGMAVQLDYLHLPLVASSHDQLTEATERLNVVSEHALAPQNWLLQMVPLQLSCNDCSIGNYRLGQVQLLAGADDTQWQLKRFTTDYKGNKFDITGAWQPDSALGNSQFSGTFYSPNIGALLTEYQVSSAISGSRSDIGFQLNWPGAPQQFQLSELHGKVQFALGAGSLTEVSDQGARLFSLFSLDSLVRKLRLDFRDVFSKGFFYNKMAGTLSLHQGVAQTSDLSIDGVPGNLSIQGYADLVQRQMDYQVAFAPKVTSSLPVIIAWMVNPATGLAALALDEVFQSAEVISRINFTVTGSFEKPVVTEVNRHSTEVPVPVRIAQPETIANDNMQPRSD